MYTYFQNVEYILVFRTVSGHSDLLTRSMNIYDDIDRQVLCVYRSCELM